MSVRTTHQWVDVLRAGDPNLRVTQQYIEVLFSVNIVSASVTESITLVDSAVPDTFTPAISESITLVDSAVPDMFTGVVTEAITVTDLATPGFVEVSITEAIIIDELLHVNVTVSVAVTEAITVNDELDLEHLLDTRVITESITIGEYVESQLNSEGITFVRSADDSITVSDTSTGTAPEKSALCFEIVAPADSATAGGTINAEITEYFLLDDSDIDWSFYTDPVSGMVIIVPRTNKASIKDLNTTQIIRVHACTERVAVNDSFDPYLIVATGDYEKTVTETITVTDIATDTAHLAYVTESITVADVTIATTGYLVIENITVTDSIDTVSIASKTLIEAISVYETLSYELVTAATLCTYSPFVGGSSNPAAPSPPNISEPVETAQGDFQLYHPVDTPTLTLTLTGPEPDDRESLQFQRIKRNSRGLSLQIYVDPQWPKVRRLAIGVAVCTEAKAQEVLDFVTTTLGQEIGFRDWRNRSWRGIIENPQNPIVRDVRGNWTVAIEFEAELTEL